VTETYWPQSGTPLSLAGFVEHVESNDTVGQLRQSVYEPTRMEEIAGWMVRLAANTALLSESIVSELRDLRNFQFANDFSPSTITLHKGVGFTIRAVIWAPPDALYPPGVFSYFEPHDHNFDFFTVGYFGPGYTTHLYEYDYDDVSGVPGESVDLKYSGTADLPPGKVMYYYANRDVHIQYPPEALSVSLNLLLTKTSPSHRRQYEFELPVARQSCTARLVTQRIDRLAQERALFDTIAALGHSQGIRLLREIAQSHEDDSTRAIAWTSLLRQHRAGDDDIAMALADRSRHVRDTVLRARKEATMR
jgi:hypothetical protein